MAKRKASGDQVEEILDEVSQAEPEIKFWERVDSYVTSTGVELKFNPVRQEHLNNIGRNLRRRWITDGEPLDPPMHEETGFGGRKILEAYDQAAIDDLPEDDPIREQWALHREATGRYLQELGLLQNRIIIQKGVANDVPQEWIEEQELIGNPLPDNDLEIMQQWLDAEVIATVEDMTNLMIIPQALGRPGLTEEGFAAWLELFRNFLGATIGIIPTVNGTQTTG